MRLPRGALALQFVLSLIVSAMLAVSPAAAQRAEESLEDAVCRLIEASARREKLPVSYFTRLIWKESSFRPYAVSPAGARGIAQFMPQTANERGLADPFDPEEAIPKAAALLAELRARFGNLGLAAAAYNGGPARVDKWLSGAGSLAAETQDYVMSITGEPVDAWKGETAARGVDLPEASCKTTTAALRRAEPRLLAHVAPLAPWGVQLSGNFSKALALASFERVKRGLSGVLRGVEPMIVGTRLRSRGARPFYRVRAPARTREAATALCALIHRAGGACVVLRS